MDCGIDYPYWILEFDHRPGEVKVSDVSKMIRKSALADVMAEVAKCDVVCANCHKDRTHARRIKEA